MSGDDLRGFIVYSEDRYHAVAVFRKADSKTWTVRCFRRNDFLAGVLKKEETIDMPDAQSDKELWLRAEIWVQDVLDELEASGEAAVSEGLSEADSGVPRKVCAVSGIRGSKTGGSINIVQCGNTIRRPPQSWGYVEELRE